MKITLAEQEEALSSLFDKLNTVLARWRKREQRAERKADQQESPAVSSRKAGLYRRAAELRGLPQPSQLQLIGEDHESGDQSGTEH